MLTLRHITLREGGKQI